MVNVTYECPLCRGLYYNISEELPLRVKCPHCDSILITYVDHVYLFERGIIPIPAPRSKAPFGLISGFLLGSAIGGTPAGIILALLGWAAGNKAGSASMAQIV